MEKLDESVQYQFKKKLAVRHEQLCVEADHLGSLPDCYKSKLRSAGYRLGYQVE